MRDYYCSNKFTYLKVDIEKLTTYNCHAAKPHKVNLDWLRANPGQLFNTETNVAERRLMLENLRNPSCEQNCYPAEDRGLTSFRMLESRPELRITETHLTPRILDITLFSDCNLMCSYCCKEHSSTWRRDLEKNGPYNLPGYQDVNRYSFNESDQLAAMSSQKVKLNLEDTQLFLEEIHRLSVNTDRVFITGGEPLLNLHLITLLEKLQHVPSIKIFTGLGISTTRLQALLCQLIKFKNVRICISADSTKSNYEFNRNGMKWNDFTYKVKLIEDSGISHWFHSVISNLTSFGFLDFYNLYGDRIKEIDTAQTPVFMSISYLDPISKKEFIDGLSSIDNARISKIIKGAEEWSIDSAQKKLLGQWLQQFAQRSSTDLSVFPKHFLDWIFK